MCHSGPARSNSPERYGSSTQRDCKWLKAFLAGALLLLLPGFASAQANLARPRITDRIDESSLTVLRGNTHPLARPQFDQGKTDPSLKLERITMMFQPTAAQ